MTTQEAQWIEFVSTRDQESRDRLILQYAPLVRYVVERLSVSNPGIMESEDVFNCGVLGLIQAIDRFDPEQGVKFETYGISRIRGAIIDELRRVDPLSRNARKMGRRIEAAYAELEEQLGRPATEMEVAEYVGLGRRSFLSITRELGRSTLSLDCSRDGDTGTDALTLRELIEDRNSPNPEDLLEKAELAEALAKIVARLPEREKQVLLLHYYEELNLRDIAAVLTISESRVYQLHTQAILRLRGLLRGRFGGRAA